MVNCTLSTVELTGIVVAAIVWVTLMSENRLTVPEAVTGSHSVVPSGWVRCSARSVYVRLSWVVPAGTVGGSVSMMRKEAPEACFGSMLGLAIRAAEIMRMAAMMAALVYFRVHFLDIILFSSEEEGSLDVI